MADYQKSWFFIVSFNNTERSISASIRGKMYEYFLADCTAEDAMKQLKPYRYRPGYQLAWLKQRAREVKRLEDGKWVQETSTQLGRETFLERTQSSRPTSNLMSNLKSTLSKPPHT